MQKPFKLIQACLCLFAIILIRPANAVTFYYWDPQGTTAGNPYTGNMSGVWESNLWSTSSAGQSNTIPWVDGGLASFGVHTGNSTPAYTVTMNNSHTVAGVFNGLNAAAAPLTINGTGPLKIVGDQGFYTYSGGSTTLAVPVGGSGRVVAEGSGPLYLNATNTYSGGTALGFTGGTTYNTVYFNNSSSFGSGAITMFVGGGAMQAEGTAAISIPNSFLATNGNLNIVGNAAGITFSGGWNLGPNILNLSAGGSASYQVIISGVITGTGALNKYGVGKLVLNGANTYTGPTTVTNGTLALGASGSINSSSNLTIAVASTFDVSAINSYNLGSTTTLLTAGTGTSSTTAATIKGAPTGTVNLGSQPITLNFTPSLFSGDTTHPSLDVSQGALVLNNNTITVSNLASTALGAGTYRLIQVGNGSSGTLTGNPNPAVTVLGKGLATGLSATWSVSNGDLNLVVKRTPVISTLTNSDTTVLGVGVTAVTLSGKLSAAGPVYPTSGETIGINLNGTNMVAKIADSAGDFSVTFDPTTIPYSTNAYPLTLAYTGDSSIAGVTNNTTLAANPFFVGGAAAGFFSGENIWCTNKSGIPMFTWSTTNVGLPVCSWTLEGAMQEQPLNDGSGNSRYSINVNPATPLLYYLMGATTNWPYQSPTGVQWITTDDSGNYYYNTTNAAISVHGVLDLPAAPVILQQPSSETILAGHTASFNVVATGSGPLSYQWYLNTNSALAGMTNQALVFTNADPTLSGSYSLVVSNLYGSAQSGAAVLQVLPPPQLTSEPVPGGFQWSGSAAPGETFLVQMATNLAPPVTWITIATNEADTNGVVQFTDTNTLANTNIFYRVAFP